MNAIARGLSAQFPVESRYCARRAFACLAAALLLASAPTAALTLRLDAELSSSATVDADPVTEQLIRFGSSDIRRRTDHARGEARFVNRENQVLSGQIAGNEELIVRMKDLSEVQERTLSVLNSTLQKSAQSAAPAVVAPVTAGLPSAAPAPTPAAPTVAGAAMVAPTTVAQPSLSIAGYELPDWLLGGLLGALVSALLAWALVRLSHRRQESMSHAAVSPPISPPLATNVGASIGADDPRTDAQVLEELWASEDEQQGQPATPATPMPSGGDTATQPRAAKAADSVDAGANTIDEPLDEVERARASSAESTAAVTPSPVAAGNKEPDAQEEVDWTRTMISRKAADPQALKEVDTLIAFEQFDKAKLLLDKMLASDPDNPEYMLRHYHVRTHGGTDTSADDADLLRAMMDGPMSDTMMRVREIGRGMMPGDPLFDESAKREEAVKLLKTGSHPLPDVSPAEKAELDKAIDELEEEDFEKTLMLDPADFLPADPRRKK